MAVNYARDLVKTQYMVNNDGTILHKTGHDRY